MSAARRGASGDRSAEGPQHPEDGRKGTRTVGMGSRARRGLLAAHRHAHGELAALGHKLATWQGLGTQQVRLKEEAWL